MPATSKQQRKLVRLIGAVADMAESVDAADLLIKGVPEKLYQHVFVSMVVAYCRPFTQNYGVGRIQCDYPTYPDFGDSDMTLRHTRLFDLRNKVLAHSSAEGTRVQIIPPDVANPIRVTAKSSFDFNIGKRTFGDVRYIEWLRVAPATFKRQLYADISELLVKAFGNDPGLDAAFELPTGHEKFQWT